MDKNHFIIIINFLQQNRSKAIKSAGTLNGVQDRPQSNSVPGPLIQSFKTSDNSM